MRLLTKKKQNEALKRMLANANIAYNEIMKSDNFGYRIDVSNEICNNLADAAYFIGGKNMMTKALELHVKYICEYDKKRRVKQ
jgi:hypothetical protein